MEKLQIRDQQTLALFTETQGTGLLSPNQEAEQHPIDPYQMSDRLMSYQEQVTQHFAEINGQQTTFEGILSLTEEQEAYMQTIKRIRNVYDIVAHPYYPSRSQKMLSDEVYRFKVHTPDETITLTKPEKALLQEITQAVNIPDDPQQQTYTFGSIPQIVDARRK